MASPSRAPAHGGIAGISCRRAEHILTPKRIPNVVYHAVMHLHPGIENEEEKEDVPNVERNGESGIDVLDTEPQAEPKPFLYRMATSFHFQLTVNAMILLNAGQMGMAADVIAPTLWDVCEHVFTAFFTAEMLVKFCAFGIEYAKNKWDFFDIVIVWVSIFSAWIQPLIGATGDGTESLGLVRMLRLLRLMRMLKVLKVIPDFLVIIDGMVGACRTMFWVTLLCFFLMYMWAVACVEIVGSSTSYPSSSDETEDILAAEVIETFNNYQYFGTVSRSLLSLLNLVLFSELDTILRPLWEIQPLVVPFLILLVLIVTFGFLNVLVAMVVDTVTQSMAKLKEDCQSSEKVVQMKFIDRLADLMFSMDEDGSGQVSVDELKHSGKIEELLDVLGLVNLPNGFGLEDLHRMLDVDGSGQLSKDEVVDGMSRLVFSSDFHRDCMVQFGLGVLKTTMFQFHETMMGEMRSQTDALRSEIQLLRKQSPSTVPATCGSPQSSGDLQCKLAAPVGSSGWLQLEAPVGQDVPTGGDKDALVNSIKSLSALAALAASQNGIGPSPASSRDESCGALSESPNAVLRLPHSRKVPSASPSVAMRPGSTSYALEIGAQSPRSVTAEDVTGCKTVLLPDDADAEPSFSGILPPSRDEVRELSGRLPRAGEVCCHEL